MRNINLSDYVVMLSPQYFNELSWFSGIKPNSHFVSIPNPALKKYDLDINKLEKRNEVLFVGRLCPQKNLEALLDIWEIVGPTHPSWSLSIVGNGELKQYLENVVLEKGLSNVSFAGDGYLIHCASELSAFLLKQTCVFLHDYFLFFFQESCGAEV